MAELTPEQEKELTELGGGVPPPPSPLAPVGEIRRGGFGGVLSPGRTLPQRMQMAQEAVAQLPARALPSTGPLAQTGQGFSNIVDFLTKPLASPAGLAATVATPVGGMLGGQAMRAAQPMVSPLMARGARAATQIGLPAVAAGGAAGVTGEDIPSGMALGATSGALGRFFGAVRGVIQRGRADTRAIKQALAEEVPWFGPPLTKGAPGSLEAVDALRQQGTGILNTQFQGVKAAIIAEVGPTAPIQIKGLTKGALELAKETLDTALPGQSSRAAEEMAKEAVRQGLFEDQTITIAEAFERVLMLKHAKSAPGALGWATREQGRQAQEALLDFIKTSTKQGAAYRDALTQWGKGQRVLDLLETAQAKGGLLRQGGGPLQPQGVINTQVWQELLHGDLQTYPLGMFPKLWKAVSRGGERSLEDRTIQLPGARFYGSPAAAGPRIGVAEPGYGLTKPIGLPHAVPQPRVGPLARPTLPQVVQTPLAQAFLTQSTAAPTPTRGPLTP